MDKQKIIFTLITIFLILGAFFLLKKEENKSSADTSEKPSEISGKKSMPTPKMEISKDKKYTAVLQTTEGNITIQLFADKTPVTVNNFIYLARKGFYNNTIFHRVIKGFMIQGGDPEGTGAGGPGYQFDDEKFEGEYTRGTVAMANAGPNTNGSQFFIMHENYDLPKNYVIFGKVIEGMETVDKIAEAEVEDNGMREMSKPIKPTKINRITIKEK